MDAAETVGWPTPEQVRRRLADGVTVVLLVGLDELSPPHGLLGVDRAATDPLAVLDRDERDRVQRFATEVLRRRHGRARVWRRWLLADVTQQPAADVGFTTDPCTACGGPHGRPGYDDTTGLGLRMNTSASDGVGAIALRRGRDVGVDIETVHRLGRSPADAAWLDPAEQAWLASVDDPDAHRRLAWVAKEAAVKATGEGLNRPLREFAVLPPGRPVDAIPGLRIRDLEAPDGVLGAVAGVGLGHVVLAVHPGVVGQSGRRAPM